MRVQLCHLWKSYPLYYLNKCKLIIVVVLGRDSANFIVTASFFSGMGTTNFWLLVNKFKFLMIVILGRDSADFIVSASVFWGMGITNFGLLVFPLCSKLCISVEQSVKVSDILCYRPIVACRFTFLHLFSHRYKPFTDFNLVKSIRYLQK